MRSDYAVLRQSGSLAALGIAVHRFLKVAARSQKYGSARQRAVGARTRRSNDGKVQTAFPGRDRVKLALMILLISIAMTAEDAKSNKPSQGASPAASQTNASQAIGAQTAPKAAPAVSARPAPAGNAVIVQTPFGSTLRAPGSDQAPAAAPNPRALADDPMMKVEMNGDTVVFRRQTPFGDQVWRRKRGELTEAEKLLVEARSKGPAPAAPVAGAAAPAKTDHR